MKHKYEVISIAVSHVMRTKIKRAAKIEFTGIDESRR